MARKTKEVAVEAPIAEEVEINKPTGDRKKRWVIFLDAAKEQNPVKFAIKEEAGEFKTIPASFL